MQCKRNRQGLEAWLRWQSGRVPAIKSEGLSSNTNTVSKEKERNIDRKKERREGRDGGRKGRKEGSKEGRKERRKEGKGKKRNSQDNIPLTRN
jgi:hypothetical protein